MLKSKTWIALLIILTLLYLAVIVYNRINWQKPGREGFSQREPFVVRREADIYDEFYVEIYDKLMLPEKRSGFELDAIVSNTQASPKSTFLEIGSGTGHFVQMLKTRGFDAYGIDQSEAMVEYSTDKYPEIDVKCGDALDPLLFERGTFSHILCMYFTVYSFQDKVAFFRNCFHWLSNNSYLVLHLVEPDKYDAVVPCGKEGIVLQPTQNRITNTELDFPDFYYASGIQFLDAGNTAIITEKFTDKSTKYVRQNEQTLYMEPVKRILEIARFCGFIVHGKMNYTEDSHQYLYFLEKQM